MDRTIGKPNSSDSLTFAPTAASIQFLQPCEFTNARPCGECLDVRKFAQNFEAHLRNVSKPNGPVNGVETRSAAPLAAPSKYNSKCHASPPCRPSPGHSRPSCGRFGAQA